jgi:hypothetical protein
VLRLRGKFEVRRKKFRWLIGIRASKLSEDERRTKNTTSTVGSYGN